MGQLIERDPHRARAAHLLRRATLTVDRDRIDAFAEVDNDTGLDRLLATAEDAATTEPPRNDDDGQALIRWWLEQMTAAESGLHERLTWYWHTVLPTHGDKVSSVGLLADQLQALRANATGDYRSLLHAYVGSGALLEYLDASWSLASNPNENLARELMELFTIGPGAYTEDDVRSAARALAGWVVEDGTVEWRREHAFVAPLLFRGVQDDWDTAKIVDHLCDQPETAVTVSARLWEHLAGTTLTPEAAGELGAWWQANDLAILPLVARILGDEQVLASPLSRPRTGLEWYTALVSVVGYQPEPAWYLDQLGQRPFAPPNVGGWPTGSRWLSPDSLLARASVVFDLDIDRSWVGQGRSGTTEELLDRCGLQLLSSNTTDALAGVRSGDGLDPDAAVRTRWRLALSCPEMSLL